MDDALLDADAITEAAIAQAGLDDFGADTWQEGLGRLVDALRAEGQLHELGVAITVEELTGQLADRARIVAWRADHPEVGDADVVPPIVIVGQARTGTTILFDLLAQDPASRAPLTWEVEDPVPPPETATYDTDPRIEAEDERLAGVDLVMPGFRKMHPMGARLAQECVRMTASDFRSVIFPTQYRVPSYARWVMYEADMAPAYRWHRQFLQHLQSRHPADGSARWLLKSPAHIWCLGDLLAEYPNALLVQTHRDPLRIIASVSSLQQVLRGMCGQDPSLPDIAAEWAEYIVEGIDRSVTAREDGTVPADRIVDVHFDAFMADPFQAIGEIYDRLGLALTADTDARMREFLSGHGQTDHGVHTYSWSGTGLDESEWRERARRYQDYFGVTSESLH